MLVLDNNLTGSIAVGTYNTNSYEIRWGNVNTPMAQWATATTQLPVFMVENLETSSIYGFQVRTNCTDGTMTAYSNNFLFGVNQDIECGRPVLGTTVAISPNSQRVFWNYEVNADRYRIRWTEADNISFMSTSIPSTVPVYTINGLKPATDYIYQVRARCGGAFQKFSPQGFFTTMNMGVQPFEVAGQTESAVLFPNPAENQLFARGIDPTSTIQIFGSTGVLVATIDGNSLTNGTDISTLPAGNYFAKVVNTNGQTQTLQFTKAGK